MNTLDGLLTIISDCLNVGNSITVNKMLAKRPDEKPHMLSVAIVSIPFGLIGLFYLLTTLSLAHIGTALLVGVLYSTSGHYFYKINLHEKPLHIMVVLRLCSVLIMILSTFVLKERLSPSQYIGFCLSFIGGLILITNRAKNNFKINKLTLYAGLSTFAGAISSTLTVYLLNYYSLWQTFTVTRIGVVLGIIMWLGIHGSISTFKAMRELEHKQIGILLMEQILRLSSSYLQNFVVSNVGSVTLVSVLSGFKPIYAWILTGQASLKNSRIKSNILALLLLAISYYLMR